MIPFAFVIPRRRQVGGGGFERSDGVFRDSGGVDFAVSLAEALREARPGVRVLGRGVRRVRRREFRQPRVRRPRHARNELLRRQPGLRGPQNGRGKIQDVVPLRTGSGAAGFRVRDGGFRVFRRPFVPPRVSGGPRRRLGREAPDADVLAGRGGIRWQGGGIVRLSHRRRFRRFRRRTRARFRAAAGIHLSARRRGGNLNSRGMPGLDVVGVRFSRNRERRDGDGDEARGMRARDGFRHGFVLVRHAFAFRRLRLVRCGLRPVGTGFLRPRHVFLKRVRHGELARLSGSERKRRDRRVVVFRNPGNVQIQVRGRVRVGFRVFLVQEILRYGAFRHALFPRLLVRHGGVARARADGNEDRNARLRRRPFERDAFGFFRPFVLGRDAFVRGDPLKRDLRDELRVELRLVVPGVRSGHEEFRLRRLSPRERYGFHRGDLPADVGRFRVGAVGFVGERRGRLRVRVRRDGVRGIGIRFHAYDFVERCEFQPQNLCDSGGMEPNPPVERNH